MKIDIPALKDRLIFLGWVAGLVIAASLLWSLTFSFRAGILLRSANRALAAIEDSRQLLSPLPRSAMGQVPLGCWFSFNDNDTDISGSFLVFTIIKGGILVPCGAELTSEGKVKDIVPLGRHAQKVIDRIPPGQIQIYTRRIESAAAAGKVVIADAE